MISNSARQALRLMLQNVEKADEIIDAIDQLTNGKLMITRTISQDVVVGPDQVYLQSDPVISPGVSVEIQAGGEMIVL